MSAEPRNCPGCGGPILPGDRVCPICGEVLEATRPAGPPPAAGSRPGDAPPAPEAGGERTGPAPASRPAGDEGGRVESEVDAAGTVPPPWERRRSYGFWRSLWLTWRDSVFRPVEFFRQLPPRGGYGSALGYAVLFTAVAILFNIYWATIEGALAGGMEAGALVAVFGGMAMSLVWLAFAIPLYVGFLFAVVAVLHLAFMVVGAGRRGFEASFRGVAYASGPAAFAIFPFFGPLLSMVWGAVLVFIGMREAQRTTNGRAVVGFLLPLIALLVFFTLLAFLLGLLVEALEVAPAS